MKIYILVIALGLNFLLACNVKRERIEEDLYNPFDTSGQVGDSDVEGDTIYSRDSINKNFNFDGTEAQLN